MKKIIEKCGQGTPNEEFFDTIAYCRLRRNYFTHILDTLNNKFLDIVNNKGVNLNSYWASVRQDCDFTKQNVEEFGENETIELLKIIRIVLQSIDEYIGGILNKEGVAEYLADQIFALNPTRINEDIVKKRKSKLATVSMQQFGFRLSEQEMENAVRTIGKK